MAGLIQPAVDEIVELCSEAGLAVHKKVMGRHCGIHRDNRAGTGVDPLNAHSLALKISLQGYSETKLENPTGFEKAVDKKLRRSQELFMARNFEEANGYLTCIPLHDVEYLHVACSHTFAALKIIEGECKGMIEQMCNEASDEDKLKVLQMCPSLERPTVAAVLAFPPVGGAAGSGAVSSSNARARH